MIYNDRYDAGQKLAEKLTKYTNDKPIIMALPRGGVVVGYEVAKMLKAPLDVIVARKIGAPFQPELGVGAIAPNGIRILNNELIRLLNIPESAVEEVIQKETIEMNRRINFYRKDLPLSDLKDKIVIVVDDGLATGVSTNAAVSAIRQMQPKKIVLAVPVAPPNTASRFKREVDEFICLNQPPDFYAVGYYYKNFTQTTDEEVVDLLQKAKNGFI